MQKIAGNASNGSGWFGWTVSNCHHNPNGIVENSNARRGSCSSPSQIGRQNGPKNIGHENCVGTIPWKGYFGAVQGHRCDNGARCIILNRLLPTVCNAKSIRTACKRWQRRGSIFRVICIGLCGWFAGRVGGQSVRCNQNAIASIEKGGRWNAIQWHLRLHWVSYRKATNCLRLHADELFFYFFLFFAEKRWNTKDRKHSSKEASAVWLSLHHCLVSHKWSTSSALPNLFWASKNKFHAHRAHTRTAKIEAIGAGDAVRQPMHNEN